MLLCDPGTVRFKSVYMQAWVRESMIKNNPDKARRRGGWKVKPRQYLRWRPADEDVMCRKDYWEWDTSIHPSAIGGACWSVLSLRMHITFVNSSAVSLEWRVQSTIRCLTSCAMFQGW